MEGNVQKMREALVAVKKSIDEIGESSLDCDPTILMAALTQVCARLSARIERALDAPLRNCDKYIDKNHARACYSQQSETPDPFEWMYATEGEGGEE